MFHCSNIDQISMPVLMYVYINVCYITIDNMDISHHIYIYIMGIDVLYNGCRCII